MHSGAMAFVHRMAHLVPAGSRVLEIGSYRVNGTPYTALADRCAEYLGLDRRPGPGVDLVSDAGQYDGRGQFDTVVSTETLEHGDPAEVLACAWRALCPGGMLILTAAAPERAPHGVDGALLQPGEFYRAITPDSLRAMLLEMGFTGVIVEHHIERGDVYAVAYKPHQEYGGEPR